MRSAIAWGGMRAVLAFVPGGGDLGVLASLLLIAIAGSLALFFSRQRNENLFLANLGVRGTVIAGCAVMIPMVGEMAVRLVT